jgi:hypothetical protein
LGKLIERLPEIAGKFGEALVNSNVALLAVRFMVALAKNIGPLVGAFIQAIPEMVVAFVDGIVIALKTIVNELANAFGLGDIFDLPDIEEKMEQMGESIQRSAAQLFEVVDLEAAARGLDLSDKIRNAIDSATSRTKNILQWLWDKLVMVWEWIRDNIIMPVWNALKAIWDFVWKNILEPFVTLLTEIWNFVWDNILEPFVTAIGTVFQWVVDNVIGPLVDGIATVFQWVVDNVVSPLIDGLTTVWNFVNEFVVSPLVDGLTTVWNFVKKNIIDVFKKGFGWVTDIVDTVADLFSTPSWLSSLKISTPTWFDKLKIKTPGWLQKFVDAVDSLTSFGGFSMGGLVKGAKKLGGAASDAYKRSDLGKATTAIGKATNIGTKNSDGSTNIGPIAVGGSSGISVNWQHGGHVVPKGVMRNGTLYAAGGAKAIGTDTVPAMLTPGEFVVNRQATRNNLGLLSFINSTRAPVAPVTPNTTISVVINAKTDLNAAQIRREVIPELERQLKRKSQEGAFMLANTGLRSNK